jgi:hypothetical protein
MVAVVLAAPVATNLVAAPPADVYTAAVPGLTRQFYRLSAQP